jgi:hypothetical protein
MLASSDRRKIEHISMIPYSFRYEETATQRQ